MNGRWKEVAHVPDTQSQRTRKGGSSLCVFCVISVK